MTSLPIPSDEQQAHSHRLIQAISDEIVARGGWISFARYMEMALYLPGLGYYSAGSSKFGAAGDFVTAPEISPLFARTLARQAAQVVRATGGDILELGAGTGRLAAQLMLELQQLESLPQHYRILEVSAHLRSVQVKTLSAMLPAELLRRVQWLDALPATVTGFVFGNEVLDALPVHLLSWSEDGLRERGVTWDGDRFCWQERPLEDEGLRRMAQRLELAVGYCSEFCPAVPALVSSLAERLQRGVMMFIDYGFPRREYYHPQRAAGTLMYHYRQHAHDDPFLYPGLQDITAHVDFTAVAETAAKNGLNLLGYASQAQFLINCGVTDLLAEVAPADMAAYLPLVAQAQKLLSPAEMGELFKVIALGRGSGEVLQGFTHGDKSHTL